MDRVTLTKVTVLITGVLFVTLLFYWIDPSGGLERALLAGPPPYRFLSVLAYGLLILVIVILWLESQISSWLSGRGSGS